MSTINKQQAGALVKVLRKATRNAKGWASTLGGVALIALGVFLAWKLGAPNEGMGAIMLGVGLVFARDQEDKPEAAELPEAAPEAGDGAQ